tara:strand:- start:75 stop:500 length:426 start_codon:yes stop_codon:yes gene_type:complete
VKKKYTTSKKDKKDWEDFTKQIGDIHPKEDDLVSPQIKVSGIKKLDLHGTSLNEANKKVEKFMLEAFNQGYRKVLIITGKGSRSKVKENPYVSEQFSVLKNSIPEFIKENSILNQKVIKIEEADKKHGGDGAFFIFFKKNN